VIDREKYASANGAEKGAYVLKKEGENSGKPDVILMASGSEVYLALDVAKLLEKENVSVRVVSMPCLELFSKQDQAYRDEVLPPEVKSRVSIEAAATLGWDRWVGDDGLAIGIDRFGESAPYQDVYEHLGFTPERIAKEAKELLNRS
jgi:transketolase